MSARTKPAVVYPESDGKPLAENTLQYDWIVRIRENVAAIFADRPDVLVAADNLIYPVEGEPKICQAPDVYVAIGRPAGRRGCYKVFEEGGIFPQVIFEVLSPGNRKKEMARKFEFYERYGTEEYYVYDPDRVILKGWQRVGGRLEEIPVVNGFVSPRLGIRFDMSGSDLEIFGPDGERFRTAQEIIQAAKESAARAKSAIRRAEIERTLADAERVRADTERTRADAQSTRADSLAAKLRALGIDPDAAGAAP